MRILKHDHHWKLTLNKYPLLILSRALSLTNSSSEYASEVDEKQFQVMYQGIHN